MPDKQTIKPGDILRIPLTEDLAAVGLILHVSKRFKKGLLVGFYEQTFRLAEEVDVKALSDEFIEIPNYIGRQMITSGRWKIIAHSPQLLARAMIPKLRVAGNLYYKDTMIQKLSLAELQNYPELVGQGGILVENKLRKHFEK